MACLKHPSPSLPPPLRIVNIARKRLYMPRYYIPTSRRQPCRDAKSCVSRATNSISISIFPSIYIGLTFLRDAKSCVSTFRIQRYKTESCIISLQRRQPVETQNLASHEQRTRFLSAYFRKYILGLPSCETQNLASLLSANRATKHTSISAAYSTFSALRSADSKFFCIFAAYYLHP